MNDSSRWLLIIALIALVVSLTNHGGFWLFFGFGAKTIFTVLLIAFGFWLIRERSCCGWDEEEAEDEDVEAAEED